MGWIRRGGNQLVLGFNGEAGCASLAKADTACTMGAILVEYG